MIKIGQMNHLTVIKSVAFGLFLDGDTLGNILLPKRYVPEGTEIGDSLDVFIYLDSNDDVIATTLTPKAMVGECAMLEVKDINKAGAFLDWGLPKDLLVPYNEMQKPLELGRSYVVCLYLDPHTGRIAASTKYGRYLEEQTDELVPHQAVDLIVCGRTSMGYKVIVDNQYLGLVYRDDAFRTLLYGEQLKGYVKPSRYDSKIDISLQPPASKLKGPLAEQILQHLRANGGASPLTDKSDPDEIYRTFNVSKGNYKNALSLLYKERKILITKEQITLVE